MKTIVVTGAQGFVGSAIVKKLKVSGHRVIPVVKVSNSEYQDSVEWDITSPLDKKLDNIDVVVHAAAKVDDWADYKESYEVNVIGTKNVIDAFPQAELFIYISSASVYDSKNSEVVISEESPAGSNLLNDYSRTKFEAERVVIDSLVASRVVLRPHIIYGPGDKKILPRLLQAKKFGRFLILGNGKNNISLNHIDNLVDAITKVVSSDKKFDGEIFNITDGKADSVNTVIDALKETLNIAEKNFHVPRTIALSIGTISEYLAKLLGSQRSPLLTPYIVKQMTSDHIIDCSKAKRTFEYSPTVEYQEGFKRL